MTAHKDVDWYDASRMGHHRDSIGRWTPTPAGLVTIVSVTQTEHSIKIAYRPMKADRK